MTSLVVTRLLIELPEVDPVLLQERTQLVGRGRPVVDQGAKVLVVVGHGAAEQRQVAGEATDRRALVDLGLQDHPRVADQRRGDVEVRVGGVDERGRGVDDLADARAGVVEGRSRLRDHRAQVGLRHRAHEVAHVGEDLGGGHRDLGLLGADLRTVVEVGAVVGLWLQLDVLLADGRLVPDQRDAVLGDLVVLVLDVEQHRDAVVGELHLGDLPDADAAIGDFGTRRRCRRTGRTSRQRCRWSRRTACRAGRSDHRRR